MSAARQLDDTWRDEEIAAFVAIDRRTWIARVEATRVHVDAERDEQRRARAKPLPRGLSPVEHGRIMREAARWKRYDNGRHCESSDAPILSASAREVLGHLVEHACWKTRERDTTIEALRVRTGYRSEKTIRRALGELARLGLVVKIGAYHRAHFRLQFANAEELRGLLKRAAASRARAAAAGASEEESSARGSARSSGPDRETSPPVPPCVGPCLSGSLILGSVPELRALPRAELSSSLAPPLDLEAARASAPNDERPQAAAVLTPSAGNGALPTADGPRCAPPARRSRESKGGESTRHAEARGASGTSTPARSRAINASTRGALPREGVGPSSAKQGRSSERVTVLFPGGAPRAEFLRGSAALVAALAELEQQLPLFGAPAAPDIAPGAGLDADELEQLQAAQNAARERAKREREKSEADK